MYFPVTGMWCEMTISVKYEPLQKLSFVTMYGRGDGRDIICKQNRCNDRCPLYDGAEKIKIVHEVR